MADMTMGALLHTLSDTNNCAMREAVRGDCSRMRVACDILTNAEAMLDEELVGQVDALADALVECARKAAGAAVECASEAKVSEATPEPAPAAEGEEAAEPAVEAYQIPRERGTLEPERKITMEKVTRKLDENQRHQEELEREQAAALAEDAAREQARLDEDLTGKVAVAQPALDIRGERTRKGSIEPEEPDAKANGVLADLSDEMRAEQPVPRSMHV